MIDKKWILLHSKKVTRQVGPEEVLKILLKNRKIVSSKRAEFLNPTHPSKIDPAKAGISKTSLDRAGGLIKRSKKEKIVVYGDYDADGLSSAAIVWESLWAKGYDVIPFMPHREEDGYGINPGSVKKLKKKYPNLGLIITVDNGIVAFDGIKTAKDLGIKTIITDHHLALDKLPPADVIVHSTELAGSGVAWFLASLFGYRSLELVALGTIADMLPLSGVNRSFVKYGIKEISKTNRVGLKLLKQKGGIGSKDEVLPWQVSFILAPRLNAAGRLSDAVDGLRLLCTKKTARAKELVEKLETINSKRQKLTIDGIDDAKKNIKPSLQKMIFAVDESYHQGIIGLIAGKLTEEFYRPSIVISKGEKISRGSARSVNGFNIIEFIRKAEPLLIDAGGHPMAAGFTIETSKINKFINQLGKMAEKEIKTEDLAPELKIDFSTDASLVGKKLYRLIQELAPFGLGNPEPLFLIKRARVVRCQALGSERQHLKLWLDDPETKAIERVVAEAIGFGWGDFWQDLLTGDFVDLVASLNLNRWRDRETIQLKIRDLRKAG
ncbi:single-stranded-DNA-specific exonuclease RecJ [Patescibacteria group bacterium]|nr:single-stranded-DNA-specific exonuclease RecJ [Patescibacteria group bacterium]